MRYILKKVKGDCIMQRIKKNICLFLAAAILLALLPTFASATVIDSGFCGAADGGLTWTLTDSGLLTISGSGAMADYEAFEKTGPESPWQKGNYEDVITCAVIEDGVTRIGDGAFNRCRMMTSVTIPASVTEIGDDAFMHVAYILSDVYYGGTEEQREAMTIGALNGDLWTAWWHYECTGPDDTVDPLFPDDVKLSWISRISNGSVQKPTAIVVNYADAPLTENADYTVTYSDNSSKTPGDYTATVNGINHYSGSFTLTYTIEDNTHGNVIMSGYCGTEGNERDVMWTYFLDGTLLLTGTGAMADYPPRQQYNHGKTVTVPTNPWVHCPVRNVIIEDGVTNVGVGAFFKENALAAVSMPYTVGAIGSSAFAGCASLTEASIPFGTEVIGQSAFADCAALASVRLPLGPIEIAQGAFDNCPALTDVYYAGRDDLRESFVPVEATGNDALLRADWHYVQPEINVTPIVAEASIGDVVTFTAEPQFAGMHCGWNDGWLWIYHPKGLVDGEEYWNIGRFDPNAATLEYGVFEKADEPGFVLHTLNYTVNKNTLTVTGFDASANDLLFIYKLTGGEETECLSMPADEAAGEFASRIHVSTEALNAANVTRTPTTLYADGSQQQPAVSVKDAGGHTLTEGADYTVTYPESKEPGTYLLQVDGINNYTGTVRKAYNVKEKEALDTARVTRTPASFYADDMQQPAVTVKNAAGKTLKEGTDYTVTYPESVEPGTYLVKIDGINAYKGTVRKAYTVKPPKEALDASLVTRTPTSFYADGTQQQPAVTVKNAAGKTLKEGVDYTVTYPESVEPGTYMVKIEGVNAYKGTVRKAYTVKPPKEALDTALVTRAPISFTANGQQQQPAVTVKNAAGKTLKEGVDYTVTYPESVEPGTYLVRIDGINAYKGTVRKAYTIK